MVAKTLLAGPGPAGFGAFAPAAATDVCSRTPQVRDRLVERTGAAPCEAVTAAHLAGIELLNLSNEGISRSQPGLSGAKATSIASGRSPLAIAQQYASSRVVCGIRT